MHNPTDTIVAPATPPGISSIAVIRVSGPKSFEITNKLYSGKDLLKQPSHTAHFGWIRDGERRVDEVVVTIFRAPQSFTREDVVEIACHGSPLIVQDIIKLYLKHGARLAEAGEFTRRAFLNGRIDLSQAEAIADLISAETYNAQQAAINQMRGGYSKELENLRQELIRFASLVELELDFSEEDVEFARRDELKTFVQNLIGFIDPLITSFDQGNVIKSGVPTVIAGKPNAGKSTLLNVLLNEERAIVSDIPGTTRDVIEDEIILDGIVFRFIDTAGLRDTTDYVEAIGVARTREQMKKASLILYLIDLSTATNASITEEEAQVKSAGIPYLLVANKTDKSSGEFPVLQNRDDVVFISAANRSGIDELKQKLVARFAVPDVKPGDTIVTSLRHYQNLVQTREALTRVLEGLGTSTTGDFLAQDIREALHHLGTITGVISTEDLLESIFTRFCIGK